MASFARGPGQTVAQADCLVRDAAGTIDARVATDNPNDFTFPGLLVEHWPVGT